MSETGETESRIRKIIHVDMDAFYAAVEQRDHPELRGIPIAVGGSPEGRGVIATASYEARKFGVRSAMSSYRAMQLCPQLTLVGGRFDAYKEASAQIREIFHEVTDLVEPLSLDEAYLDVTENHWNLPSATEIAKIIKARIFETTGLRASAGVSYNKFLAKVASDYHKPDGLCVIPPHKAEAFLTNLPIEQFYGIGAKTAPRLKELGINTGGDLRALDDVSLEALLGRSAGFYYQLVRGIDHREIETSWVRKSVGSETTFASDLLEMGAIHAELEPLIAEVFEWMQRRDTYGKTVTVKVKYNDFRQITRRKTVLAPVKDLDTLTAMAHQLLELTDAGHIPIRLVGITMSTLIGPDSEASASTAPVKPTEQLPLPLDWEVHSLD